MNIFPINNPSPAFIIRNLEYTENRTHKAVMRGVKTFGRCVFELDANHGPNDQNELVINPPALLAILKLMLHRDDCSIAYDCICKLFAESRDRHKAFTYWLDAGQYISTGTTPPKYKR